MTDSSTFLLMILPWILAIISFLALIVFIVLFRKRDGAERTPQALAEEAERWRAICSAVSLESERSLERNLVVRLEALGHMLRQGGASTEQNISVKLEQMRVEQGQIRQDIAQSLNEGQSRLRLTFSEKMQHVTEMQSQNLTQLRTVIEEQMTQNLGGKLEQIRVGQGKMQENVTQNLNEGRDKFQIAFSENMRVMAERQNQHLAQLRTTVEEQLHGAVEKQMQSSFQRVVEQMATMQNALGEVRGMTAQMSDLKRLFSNIKTRGGWGEAQCRIILDDILPGKYETNCQLSDDSREEVEFAVRMPVKVQSGGRPPLLAIDSKFPTAAYERLIQASEEGNLVAEAASLKELERNIRQEAAKISSKYIRPPVTVDFAVLYLPTDGLYTEIARMPGVIDSIGRDHRVLVMGPSLLPALLRTVSLGYMTLALEEHTEEISQLLGVTRHEMSKMDKVLEKLHRNAGTMGRTIDEARRRTRAIDRKLRDVDKVEDGGANYALPHDEDNEEDNLEGDHENF